MHKTRRCLQHMGLARSVGIACMLLSALASLPARAHHQGIPQLAPEDGISIPNLSHGQMAVIAENRAAIQDLAARQAQDDRVTRRLESFINIQFGVCMWGLMPRSLEDETSPFNECTHAYLAATRALLVHLQAVSADHMPVEALVQKIEIEMLRNRASLALCRYSDEPFNTAEIVNPHWADIPSHPLSLATFGSLALTASIGCACMAARRKRDALRDRKASTARA
jgi:hypothetical protein